VQTLLITDLHLNSKTPGLLESQVSCFKAIVDRECPDDVIIMGDIFMHRKPSPSELLAFGQILNWIGGIPTVVLRGNHDSETKADDGITALSVFDNDYVQIVTHTYTDKLKNRVFIPHYENQEHIIHQLEMVPKDYTVFGHFGYAGCLNSIGDSDFSLSLSNFANTTYLGHIHGFIQGRGGLQEPHPVVTCLGTPYTTNFGEAFKPCFYAILDGYDVEYKEPGCGPRHLLFEAKELENNLETINDPSYHTFLRVMVDADHYPIPYEQLRVHSIDVKYSPVFNEEEISSYEPDKDLFAINEKVITDYVDQANSTISAEMLMQGYRLLQDEN
tara:strand:+ start:806 stop:1795 length:990 start_codon:yes stop_codon:yes gene_type:complete